MKKAFTLIEMAIVLLVIGILMAATMRFWSGRITDLKAQSIKEQFIGRYNDLYSQNMTSSFRDGQKYEQMTIVLWEKSYYILDQRDYIDTKLSDFVIENIRFATDANNFTTATLSFKPYQLWCKIMDGDNSWKTLYFTFTVPENGKQYCFEIPSETCKLIEIKCNE